MKNDVPGANFLANQKKWMADLEDFLVKFPRVGRGSGGPVPSRQRQRVQCRRGEARQQYQKLVESYPATEHGKKAAGALRRLDLVGKPIELKGMGLQNEPVDSSQYRGKPILVVFWASWASPVKVDLPDLIKVYEKYHERGLEIVGVDLDNERGELDAFLKEHHLAWPQIFEAGGIESRLAVEYGIISLPTIFLVDADGKVVNRSLRSRRGRPAAREAAPDQAGGRGRRSSRLSGDAEAGAGMATVRGTTSRIRRAAAELGRAGPKTPARAFARDQSRLVATNDEPSAALRTVLADQAEPQRATWCSPVSAFGMISSASQMEVSSSIGRRFLVERLCNSSTASSCPRCPAGARAEP